jgi:hypothetical protein
MYEQAAPGKDPSFSAHGRKRMHPICMVVYGLKDGVIKLFLK